MLQIAVFGVRRSQETLAKRARRVRDQHSLRRAGAQARSKFPRRIAMENGHQRFLPSMLITAGEMHEQWPNPKNTIGLLSGRQGSSFRRALAMQGKFPRAMVASAI